MPEDPGASPPTQPIRQPTAHRNDQNLYWDASQRRGLRRFHFLSVFWYRAQHWNARRMPEWLKPPATWFVAGLFLLFLPRSLKRAVARNQKVVLGPCGRLATCRRVFRVLHQWALCRTERYEQFVPNPRPPTIDVEGIEHWEQAASGARGALLVTAHLGNFEAGNMIPPKLLGRRLHLARAPEPDPEAQRFMLELIARYQDPNIVTHVLDDDFRIGMILLHALRDGELAAMAGDRSRGDARCLDVRMFGRPFAMPKGPVTVAQAAEVPIVPTFFLRVARSRYRLIFRPLLEVDRTRPKAEAIADTMAKIAREIEWAILQAPEQWFCFADIWPGEAADAISRTGGKEQL